MLKVVIALILLAHGIGHSLGLLQVFKVATVNPAWNGESWALSSFAGPTGTQTIGVILWTIAIVGFAILAAMVVGWVPETWWGLVAVASALASLAGLILFPVAFPVASTIGAAVVDVVVLVAILWYHWVPSELSL